MKKSSTVIIGAVFTALLSTICCLPAFIFLFFGVSSGVLSFFTTLEYTRVPFTILSIVFLYFIALILGQKSLVNVVKKRNLYNIFYLVYSLF